MVPPVPTPPLAPRPDLPQPPPLPQGPGLGAPATPGSADPGVGFIEAFRIGDAVTQSFLDMVLKRVGEGKKILMADLKGSLESYLQREYDEGRARTRDEFREAMDRFRAQQGRRAAPTPAPALPPAPGPVPAYLNPSPHKQALLAKAAAWEASPEYARRREIEARLDARGPTPLAAPGPPAPGLATGPAPPLAPILPGPGQTPLPGPVTTGPPLPAAPAPTATPAAAPAPAPAVAQPSAGWGALTAGMAGAAKVSMEFYRAMERVTARSVGKVGEVLDVFGGPVAQQLKGMFSGAVSGAGRGFAMAGLPGAVAGGGAGLGRDAMALGAAANPRAGATYQGTMDLAETRIGGAIGADIALDRMSASIQALSQQTPRGGRDVLGNYVLPNLMSAPLNIAGMIAGAGATPALQAGAQIPGIGTAQGTAMGYEQAAASYGLSTIGSSPLQMAQIAEQLQNMDRTMKEVALNTNNIKTMTPAFGS